MLSKTHVDRRLTASPAGRRSGGALQTAVERRSLAAARQLAVMKAPGLGVGEDWPGAAALLKRAAEGGHPAALRALGALGLFCGAGDGAASTLLQAARSKGDAIAALLPATPDKAGALSIAGPAPLAPQTGVLALAAPRVEALTGLVPQPFCAYLAAAAAPLLEPSAVVDSAQGRASHAEYRTSDGCVLGVASLDLMLIALHRALCASVGIALDRSELMGVLRCRPGQEYRPHYDSCRPTPPITPKSDAPASASRPSC